MVAVFDAESVAWTGDPAGCTYSDVSGHDRVSVWDEYPERQSERGRWASIFVPF